MDGGNHKHYHVHGFDSRKLLETYLSDKEEAPFMEDAMKLPMKKIHSTFIQGHIKGDNLIDISAGSFIHHLYPIVDFFKAITLLRVSERCVMELNKWHNTRTGAFDFSHTAQMLTEISGNSDQSQDPDMKLKAAVKPVLLCDLNEENLIDPETVPPADCVVTVCLLDYTSKGEGDYKRNLKKIVKLLKPGGHLILFGVLNATYCMVGEERFHAFKYDEKFVGEALVGEGLSIDYCEVNARKGQSELSDYEAIIFIAAHKGK